MDQPTNRPIPRGLEVPTLPSREYRRSEITIYSSNNNNHQRDTIFPSSSSNTYNSNRNSHIQFSSSNISPLKTASISVMVQVLIQCHPEALRQLRQAGKLRLFVLFCLWLWLGVLRIGGETVCCDVSRPSTSHTHPQQPQQPHHIYGQQHQVISNNNTSNSLGNRQPPQPQQQQHHLPHQQPPIILQHHQHQQSSTVASSQNTTGGSSNPTGNPSNDPNQMRGRISSASGSGTCSTSQQQLPSVGYPNPSSHHPHQVSNSQAVIILLFTLSTTTKII